MPRRPLHAPECPRTTPQHGEHPADCTCGETSRRDAARTRAGVFRITFRKKKHQRFQLYDTFDVSVNGERVGGLNAMPNKIGYAISPNERLGLAWKNTWADGETFATVDAAKSACITYLRAALRPRTDR